MAQIKVVQNSFTSGEVGAYLDAREDLDIYTTGAKTIENFFVLPQGGLLRRTGFEYIAGTNLLGSDESHKGWEAHSRIIPFRFSTDQEYVLVLQAGKFTVFKNGTNATTVTDALCAWTTTTTFTLNAAKSLADGEILTQLNSGATATVVGATSSSTSVVVANITGVWTTNSGDTITGSTTGALSTYASGLGSPPNIDEWRYTQTFDTMILVHEDYAPVKITRSTHTSWAIAAVSHTFLPLANFDNGITLTPGATTGTGITITASANPSSYFSNNDYVRINGGLCKLTSVSSSTSITANVEEKLNSTALAGSTEYQQTAFSSAKGYPKSVTFHQNRLIYGGSKNKPQTIFGSQTGDFFNFKPTVASVEGSDTIGTVTDDSAFAFTIGADTSNIIRHIVSKQTLFIFTSDGEFEMTGSPVTPTNVNVRLQTKYGSVAGALNPTTVDNEVLFVSQNGRELRGFVFDFNSDSFYAKNYTIVSHDVLSNPQDIAFMRAHRNTNQNYIFIVNDTGELAVLGLNVEKQVAGWSRFTTDGKFKKVVAVHDSDTEPETQRLYALVERTRKKDSGDVITCYHLERLTEELIYLDGYMNKNTGSTFSSIGSAFPFANQSVNIEADGIVHADETVTSFSSGANITLDDSFSDVNIGKNYTSTLKTLTLPVTLNGIPYRGEQITKISALANLNNTQALKIDGTEIDFRFAGQNLGTAISPFTGTKKIFVSGVSTDPIVTLTVDTPLQSTILGITTEVKFGT
jgi:hypothetical protein